MADPRNKLLERIDIEKTRVVFEASHIVLLCGGKVKYKEKAEDPDPPIASLRHAITHAFPEYETFRPEDITEWHSDGLFRNLMNFERELAGICSLVVIILESPGAIAELGAFSQLAELSHKLLAIKSRDFETAQHLSSFINLGILRFLKEYSDSAVRNYPWSVLAPHAIGPQLIDDVVADIADTLDALPNTAKFDREAVSHIAVLIYEIVNIFVAVKETEFYSYFEYFDVTIGRDDLKRKLFLLEKFGLLKRETYSDATFYMLGKNKFHRMRLGSKDEVRIDTLRANIECLAFYKADTRQRNRHRAITQASGGVQ